MAEVDGKAHCCLFCYRLFNHDTEKVNTSQTQSQFFRLLKHYFLTGSDSSSISTAWMNSMSTAISSSSDSVGNILSTCMDCSGILNSFCAHYEELKVLEIKLNWRLQTLTHIVESSERVKLRQTMFQVKLKEMKKRMNDGLDVDGFGFIQEVKSFRRKLVEICTKKLKATYPRVAIRKFDSNSNQEEGESQSNQKRLEENLRKRQSKNCEVDREPPHLNSNKEGSEGACVTTDTLKNNNCIDGLQSLSKSKAESVGVSAPVPVPWTALHFENSMENDVERDEGAEHNELPSTTLPQVALRRCDSLLQEAGTKIRKVPKRLNKNARWRLVKRRKVEHEPDAVTLVAMNDELINEPDQNQQQRLNEPVQVNNHSSGSVPVESLESRVKFVKCKSETHPDTESKVAVDSAEVCNPEEENFNNDVSSASDHHHFCNEDSDVGTGVSFDGTNMTSGEGPRHVQMDDGEVSSEFLKSHRKTVYGVNQVTLEGKESEQVIDDNRKVKSLKLELPVTSTPTISSNAIDKLHSEIMSEPAKQSTVEDDDDDNGDTQSVAECCLEDDLNNPISSPDVNTDLKERSLANQTSLDPSENPSDGTLFKSETNPNTSHISDEVAPESKFPDHDSTVDADNIETVNVSVENGIGIGEEKDTTAEIDKTLNKRQQGNSSSITSKTEKVCKGRRKSPRQRFQCTKCSKKGFSRVKLLSHSETCGNGEKGVGEQSELKTFIHEKIVSQAVQAALASPSRVQNDHAELITITGNLPPVTDIPELHQPAPDSNARPQSSEISTTYHGASLTSKTTVVVLKSESQKVSKNLEETVTDKSFQKAATYSPEDDTEVIKGRRLSLRQRFQCKKCSKNLASSEKLDEHMETCVINAHESDGESEDEDANIDIDCDTGPPSDFDPEPEDTIGSEDLCDSENDALPKEETLPETKSKEDRHAYDDVQKHLKSILCDNLNRIESKLRRCEKCGDTFPSRVGLRLHEKLKHAKSGSSGENNVEPGTGTGTVESSGLEPEATMQPEDSCDSENGDENRQTIGPNPEVTEKMTTEVKHCSDSCGIGDNKNASGRSNRKRKRLPRPDANYDFKCDFKGCTAIYCRKSDLSKHIQSVHSEIETKYYSCSLCNNAPYTYQELILHQNSVHLKIQLHLAATELQSRPCGNKPSDEVFKCPVSTCPEKFLNKETLEGHSLLHGEFKCQFCPETKSYAPELAIHEALNHKDQKPSTKPRNWSTKVELFSCPRCDFPEYKEVIYIQHFLRAHLNLAWIAGNNCCICKAVLESGGLFKGKTITRHYEGFHDTSAGDTVYRCDGNDCDAYFRTDRQLKSHKFHLHNEKKKFVCSECNKGFASGFDLRQHGRNMHKFAFYLTCPHEDCKYSFPDEESLRKHVLKMHIRAKDKSRKLCPHCGIICKSKTGLASHIRFAHEPTTFERKTNACSQCGKQFKTLGNLEVHVLGVHVGPDGWKYSCDICNKKCLTWTKLEEHKRTHAKEKPFTCEHCGLRYAHRHNFRHHLKSKHGITNLPKNHRNGREVSSCR